MSRQKKTNTPFEEEVLAFYQQGHSVSETAERFNLTKGQVNTLARRNKVSNGRTFQEGGREHNRLLSLGLIPAPEKNQGAIVARENARKRWAEKLESWNLELVDYCGKGHNIEIKCKQCGETFQRKLCPDVYKSVITCPSCMAKIKQLECDRKEAEIRKIKDKREAEKLARQAEKQKEHDERLNAPRICKVCGREYTIASYMQSIRTKYERDSGFCSAFCRDKAKHDAQLRNNKKYRAQGKRLSENHYVRAIKLGLPAEKGITKKALQKRDGDRCAICSLPLQMDGDFRAPLYWSVDHIIPLAKGIVNGKGGHTWDNVQRAHRQCNSAKRDLIGKEWNNGNN